MSATALDIGTTRDRIRDHLKKQGIARSGATGGACYRHVDEVRQWAAEGVAFSEIGRRVGTTHAKVAAFLKKHDIPYTSFVQTGHNNPSWRGGRMIDKDGYVLIRRPDHPRADRHGYVREHRLTMETVLGRGLEQHEVVHHLDGDKQNNDPANLEVFASNGQHLQRTLIGKPHRLSAEGTARIREATHQRDIRRRAATRAASSQGGQMSSDIDDPTQE